MKEDKYWVCLGHIVIERTNNRSITWEWILLDRFKESLETARDATATWNLSQEAWDPSASCDASQSSGQNPRVTRPTFSGQAMNDDDDEPARMAEDMDLE